MDQIEIQNKKYRLKTFDELTGGDWRRLTLNFERAVEVPDQFIPMMRAAAVIVCPTAVKDSRKWTELQAVYAGAAALTHLSECCATGSEWMKRHTAAGEVLTVRLESLAKRV